MPKCKAHHQPVYSVVLPSASVYFGICWCEGKGQRERDLFCLFISFGFSLTEQFQQSVSSSKWTVLQRTHVKLANPWHRFSWALSHIALECSSSLTKVKAAPLEYGRTDSGEAHLKRVAATSMLRAPCGFSFEVKDRLSIYFCRTRWLSALENPIAMLQQSSF